MPGGLFQDQIYLLVLTGIGIDSGNYLTSFPLAMCIKIIRETKIPRRKSTQNWKKIQIENQRWVLDSGYMESCLGAQKRFFLFKGPGSFKYFLNIGGNVEFSKAYTLIPLTPPSLVILQKLYAMFLPYFTK